MTGPLMRAVIRRTPENHTETAPSCDDACQRWGARAHAHICPDGLYDDTPFLDLTAWCSCGVRLGQPVHVDVSADEDYLERMDSSGKVFVGAFELHMQVAHGIDIHNDEDWLDRLSRPA